MKEFKTEQEKFWAESFGSEYINRNRDERLVASNMALFRDIIKNTNSVKTIIEFGANIGNNIIAIKSIMPGSHLAAIEINEDAVNELNKIPGLEVFHGSILDMEIEKKYDFVFTKGVLIHINPEMLKIVYRKMYTISNKYICIIEYYNPTPVTINYRGHVNRLFKRDFAGELLDLYPELKLIDYGFCYHRDLNFPLDDLTWFLLSKE